MEINVLIDEEFQGYLETDWLQRVAEQVITAQGAGTNVELGLVITGQERVQQLNRNYRQKDEATDVLAFALLPEKAGADSPPFVTPPDGVRHLGEVIISYPQAAIQAAEHGHPIPRELAILIIHGVLHLLGYDHEAAEQQNSMSAKEVEILSYVEGAKG